MLNHEIYIYIGKYETNFFPLGGRGGGVGFLGCIPAHMQTRICFFVLFSFYLLAYSKCKWFFSQTFVEYTSCYFISQGSVDQKPVKSANIVCDNFGNISSEIFFWIIVTFRFIFPCISQIIDYCQIQVRKAC